MSAKCLLCVRAYHDGQVHCCLQAGVAARPLRNSQRSRASLVVMAASMPRRCSSAALRATRRSQGVPQHSRAALRCLKCRRKRGGPPDLLRQPCRCSLHCSLQLQPVQLWCCMLCAARPVQLWPCNQQPVGGFRSAPLRQVRPHLRCSSWFCWSSSEAGMPCVRTEQRRLVNSPPAACSRGRHAPACFSFSCGRAHPLLRHDFGHAPLTDRLQVAVHLVEQVAQRAASAHGMAEGLKRRSSRSSSTSSAAMAAQWHEEEEEHEEGVTYVDVESLQLSSQQPLQEAQRSACPRCGKRQASYCVDCVVPLVAGVPRLRLPVQVRRCSRCAGPAVMQHADACWAAPAAAGGHPAARREQRQGDGSARRAAGPRGRAGDPARRRQLAPPAPGAAGPAPARLRPPGHRHPLPAGRGAKARRAEKEARPGAPAGAGPPEAYTHQRHLASGGSTRCKAQHTPCVCPLPAATSTAVQDTPCVGAPDCPRFRRALVLEGSWQKARALIATHPRLQGLRCVKLAGKLRTIYW